jgi:hypothetical protein
MPRNRLLLVGAAVVVVIGLWWWLRSGSENVAVDLIQQLPAARQQPGPEAFSVVEATINGEPKQAITIQNMAGTRITWPVTIPDNGWLKVSLGVLEPGWTMQGDGVLFGIGVSDGMVYDEMLSLTLNPYNNASDRRWNEISLDLSPYAGETVDLIFNTRSGPQDDRNGDFAAWGDPRVVVQ